LRKKRPGMKLKGTAPAKVNLALHVLGRLANGYHEISSLVVFTTLGDTLTIAPSGPQGLTVRGPFADCVPHDESNLACRALRSLGCDDKLAVTLDKHLPVEAGLGGGSSNAATAMRMAAGILDLDLPAPAATVTLGSDIPVCLFGMPALVGGVGERISPVLTIPNFFLVLVNPMLPLATRDVYHAVTTPANRALDMPSTGISQAAFIVWLQEQTNDLEAAAATLEPRIHDVITTIHETSGCLLARMSGSGTTCFGLYANRADAACAARSIATAHTDWWVRDTQLLPDTARSAGARVRRHRNPGSH